MRILILAVGRLKAGPDRLVVDRYLERGQAAGRALGLTLELREFPESKAARAEDRMAQEAATLAAALPEGARLILLDERGTSPTSLAFAREIAALRDGGLRDLVFAVGGADGHGEAIRNRAASRIALGAMTWPHQMVRLLIAEQLYRAMTILSGHPYHRE